MCHRIQVLIFGIMISSLSEPNTLRPHMNEAYESPWTKDPTKYQTEETTDFIHDPHIHLHHRRSPPVFMVLVSVFCLLLCFISCLPVQLKCCTLGLIFILQLPTPVSKVVQSAFQITCEWPWLTSTYTVVSNSTMRGLDWTLEVFKRSVNNHKVRHGFVMGLGRPG